jgi:hypothetical protein
VRAVTRYLVVIALAGCFHDSAPQQQPVASTAPRAEQPKPDSLDKQFAAMEIFRDRMCACVDDVCAETVLGDLRKWESEMLKKEQNEPPIDLSPERAKFGNDLAVQFDKCAREARARGNPCSP